MPVIRGNRMITRFLPAQIQLHEADTALRFWEFGSGEAEEKHVLVVWH